MLISRKLAVFCDVPAVSGLGSNPPRPFFPVTTAAPRHPQRIACAVELEQRSVRSTYSAVLLIHQRSRCFVVFALRPLEA
jgi:hypothetical protein